LRHEENLDLDVDFSLPSNKSNSRPGDDQSGYIDTLQNSGR